MEEVRAEKPDCLNYCKGLNVISYNEAEIDFSLPSIKKQLALLSEQYHNYKRPYIFTSRFKGKVLKLDKDNQYYYLQITDLDQSSTQFKFTLIPLCLRE